MCDVYERAVIAVVMLSFADGTATAADGRRGVELGRRLFERNWMAAAPDGSPLGVVRGGEGLGPLFNAASCVVCHRQGGVGGGGPAENDVEILALAVPLASSASEWAAATARAAAIHPAFAGKSHVMLHRFGRDPADDFAAYESFRGPIGTGFAGNASYAGGRGSVASPFGDGLPYQLVRRNSPALFGLGAIERVPPEALRQLAERQQAEHSPTAGVPADQGRAEYGWRSRTAGLDQCIRNACATEPGLQVCGRTLKVDDQADWPGSLGSGRTVRKVDLGEDQVAALVAFVRSRPAPVPVVPDDPADAAAAAAGRKRFGEIGCAACHVETVGPAMQVYSDLLLHDRGESLADRVAAPKPSKAVTYVDRRPVSVVSSSASSGSYHPQTISTRSIAFVPEARTVIVPPSRNELRTAAREWRTPPLWGVADAAPYLHDSRAGTLDEAIRAHDGQGHAAAERYAAMDEPERRSVLAFLGTLRAPQ